MNWKEVKVIMNYYGVSYIFLSRFIGVHKDTIRKNVDKSKDVNLIQERENRLCALFLPHRKNIEELYRLYQKISTESMNETNKNFVQSQMDIFEEFSTLLDRQLNKRHFDLVSYDLESGAMIENNIKNDYILMFNKVSNNYKALSNFIKERSIFDIDIPFNKSIIVSLKLNSKDYKDITIDDANFMIPDCFEDTVSELYLYINDGKENKDVHSVTMSEDILEISREVVKLQNYMFKGLSLKKFVSRIAKFYREYLSKQGGGLVIYTGYESNKGIQIDEMYKLYSLLDDRYKRKLESVPIKILNYHFINNQFFQVDRELSLFEVAKGMGFDISKYDVNNVRDRSIITNKILNVLTLYKGYKKRVPRQINNFDEIMKKAMTRLENKEIDIKDGEEDE